MQPRFDSQTLVTLTAPTCAGKSFLLEELVKQFGFERIVSTTDRAPRQGEIDGVHYHFISTEQSKELEAQGALAELVTYNGVRYGVTHAEMADKMSRSAPPIVILEPKGLEIYRKYCGSHGWQMFSIYVETQERVRLGRLVERTTADIVTSLIKRQDEGTMRMGDVYMEVLQHVNVNNKRLKAILEEERLWSHQNRWDVLADGTSINRALEQIRAGVAYRNSRSDIYK